ncbi:MAG: putative motility protein [Gammaproteobacteria bacterium]|nr:putative motility protein [Gammaproteobacteria bacterium]
MDVSGIATSTVSQAGQNSQTGIAVHNKALEIQEQNATQLIESLPDPSSSLGQHIDIKV